MAGVREIVVYLPNGGNHATADIVRGSATVILAMADGKRIAATIDDYVRATSVEVTRH